jgi:hypothetical protein
VSRVHIVAALAARPRILGLVLSLAVVLAVIAAAGGSATASPASRLAATVAESSPQTTWAACNANAGTTQPSTFHPLSDAAARALVTLEPETRQYNGMAYTLNGRSYPATNNYVPGWLAIIKFRASKTSNGQTAVQANPYNAYVDGRDGIKNPSTDDLIQWAAHKWGIPEDWLRAQYALESGWNAFTLGDDTAVSSTWYAEYPSQARVPNSSNVYQSMGLSQIKWAPDGSLGAGTEPLRWESTAFNVDFQAATLRFFYDNPSGARSLWGDSSYVPCQQWNSIGGWYSPYPWNNAGQASYIAKVQTYLNEQIWTTPNFLSWLPTSFPPGISFP